MDPYQTHLSINGWYAITYLWCQTRLSKCLLSLTHPLIILLWAYSESLLKSFLELSHLLDGLVFLVESKDEHGGSTPRAIAEHQHLLSCQVDACVTNKTQ